MYQFRVRRDDLRRHEVIELSSSSLDDGQLRLAVDRFAFTANNISYAVFGKEMAYWNFFPAAADWGCIPVWGFADVVESRAEGIAPGERLFGYWPMASEAVLAVGRVSRLNLFDDTPHRRELPAAYQVYSRTAADPAYAAGQEGLQSLLWPLFITSFLAEDFLADNDYFAARQVLIASASSKTAAGISHLLARREGHPVKVIGLTSERNVAFVEGIGDCDAVISYDRMTELDANTPTTYVDMSGDGQLLHDVHLHFGDALKYSCIIGATHWENRATQHALPGAKPQFFFAPTQYQKRHQDWGPGGVEKRFALTWSAFRPQAANWLQVESRRGPAAIADTYLEVLGGKASPAKGYILAF